jgi:NADH dehydrogenase FAD-containing subunit
MSQHLVLVGAGHAHMMVMQHLAEFPSAGHRVTVIGPGPHHYYSGMGPGMLSGIYRPEEIRFNVREMAERRGATFVQDRVVAVDAAARELRLSDGNRIDYDVVSFNTGSGVPVDARLAAHPHVVPVKPIERLLHARERILADIVERRLNVVVAGGGPAGVEVAANLRRLAHEAGRGAEITLVAGDRLLASLGARVRGMVLRRLRRLGVTVIEGARATGASASAVLLGTGASLACDYLFAAVGVAPSSLFRDSGLPVGPDGGLRVNRHLQCVAHPEIFGGGDCICFEPRPLARVGVYAVRENPILLENLRRTLDGGPLAVFTPQPRYLLAFNMGDGTAVVAWKSIVFGGRIGFRLKDHLDRSFMRRFQAGA